MANQLLRSILKPVNGVCLRVRAFSMKQDVATRARDPTFEKYMHNYKHFNKVVMIQDLILSDPCKIPPSVSIEFLSRLELKLRFNRGALPFLRKYPHVFKIFKSEAKGKGGLVCELTDKVMEISRLEAEAIRGSLPLVVERMVRLLSMSLTKSLPLMAIYKVWRELGLPDDFQESVIARNPQLFSLSKGDYPNTHVLNLVASYPSGHFTAAVEDWRVLECCKENAKVDRTEIQYGFKQEFPPRMKLGKSFRMNVKKWQKEPYIEPYDEWRELRTKSPLKVHEKRAVAIVHEFMSLTVEKLVEVEKISHFKNWFGINFKMRDLFLDHPGIFYLTTKGKSHTVFLREAYERGRLINSNPVYEARMKLLYLVLCGHRGQRIASPSSVNEGADTSDKIDDQISASSASENEEEDQGWK